MNKSGSSSFDPLSKVYIDDTGSPTNELVNEL